MINTKKGFLKRSDDQNIFEMGEIFRSRVDIRFKFKRGEKYSIQILFALPAINIILIMSTMHPKHITLTI